MFNIKENRSKNESVKKFIFTNSKHVAEAVLYKYPNYEERTVICCSTQSGCPVGCTFCGTGKNFSGNLSREEIVFQVDHCIKDSGIPSSEMKNLQIMFMSMGEPWLNMDNLLFALEKLHRKYNNAKLLVSTSAPEISFGHWESFIHISEKISKIGLQFSVHESSDKERDKLIPFKNKLTLSEISQKGLQWHEATGRKPFFNYCVHEKNNSENDVDRLLKFFPCDIFESTISVICESDETVACSIDRQRTLAEGFAQKMINKGYSTRVFNPAGQDDIGGGCGQLWETQNWFRGRK